MYDPSSTMREARERYFEVNGFGADGGYEDAWVDFKLGPIPFPFPNTSGRKRALKIHDMHHVLTGYRTDIRGEFEISAWEVGAGCKSFLAAWFLNLGGLTGGVLIAPRRTFAAFVRGRHTQSLYGRDMEALLGSRVGEMRAELGLDDATPPARLADAALFAGAAAAGLVLGGLFMAVGVVLAPIALLAGVVRSPSQPAAAG